MLKHRAERAKEVKGPETTTFPSFSPVGFHVSTILSKLNVSNRAEAIVQAVPHKLVT